MSDIEKIIGKGMVFPIELNSQGRPDLHADLTLIRSALLNLLNWPMFTRFFDERYGTRLHEALSEPDDALGRSLVRTFTIEAIRVYEPRVEIDDIEFNFDGDGVVLMLIRYYITNTRIEDTFVYPFYLTDND